ncbi:glycosyltransferase family 2 protein [Phycisphaerales bacterium AB-hyl4]|uniref:Glycosyltransferase family 2 protein n=1 Tax=Natronomicrosphaera hydrolytica TaxID=3242702 RepID=A0ABV4U3M3_9BACT
MTRDLSIIIISYNTRELLDACLASVYDRLGGLDAEVIVVDNASADGSADMVRERYPQARLIENQANTGFAAANNQAIEIAVGRHVLLLNSDTYVLGDVLAASVRYMDEHEQVGAMGCRVLNTDRTLQLTCSQTPGLVNLVLLTSGLWRLNRPRWLGRYQMKHWDRTDERDVDVISGCYLMVRRTVIEQVGPLDDAFFFFGEETDWCTRIRQAGWALRFAPVGEIVHYGSASAASLGHERDLLLTNGLVRYHVKHSGYVMAFAVWGLLLGFNLSRCMYWTLRSLVQRGGAARDRRDHFRGVVREYAKAWPLRHEVSG